MRNLQRKDKGKGKDKDEDEGGQRSAMGHKKSFPWRLMEVIQTASHLLRL
jgi:hypothetical protein